MSESFRGIARATARNTAPGRRFTTNMPYYMQLADFSIGKPGPGSIAEALAMALPAIVENNAWTLPQERYNTKWVREKEVGRRCHFRTVQPRLLTACHIRFAMLW